MIDALVMPAFAPVLTPAPGAVVPGLPAGLVAPAAAPPEGFAALFAAALPMPPAVAAEATPVPPETLAVPVPSETPAAPLRIETAPSAPEDRPAIAALPLPAQADPPATVRKAVARTNPQRLPADEQPTAVAAVAVPMPALVLVSGAASAVPVADSPAIAGAATPKLPALALQPAVSPSPAEAPVPSDAAVAAEKPPAGAAEIPNALAPTPQLVVLPAPRPRKVAEAAMPPIPIPAATAPSAAAPASPPPALALPVTPDSTAVAARPAARPVPLVADNALADPEAAPPHLATPTALAPLPLPVVAAPMPVAAPISVAATAPTPRLRGRPSGEPADAALPALPALPPLPAPVAVRHGDSAPTMAATAPAEAPRPSEPALTVTSQALGDVRIGLEGGAQDLRVSLALAPGGAALVAADAARLAGDLAAGGIRLQSLDVGSSGGGDGSRGGEPRQRFLPPAQTAARAFAGTTPDHSPTADRYA